MWSTFFLTWTERAQLRQAINGLKDNPNCRFDIERARDVRVIVVVQASAAELEQKPKGDMSGTLYFMMHGKLWASTHYDKVASLSPLQDTGVHLWGDLYEKNGKVHLNIVRVRTRWMEKLKQLFATWSASRQLRLA